MADAELPLTVADPAATGNDQPGMVARFLDALDDIFDWCEDRANPILVKEARQSIKSNQFLITFILLLVFGWAWTFLGVSFGSVGSNRTIGPQMFVGYFWILLFPLMVILPFSAYRSLAGEIEDRTYELLSITTLGAYRVVSGKLASSLLQLMVYYSALLPCLAFTYTLRGLDLPSMLVLLGAAFVLSMSLCMAALFLATLTYQRAAQIFGMVVLLILCGWVYMGFCGISLDLIEESFIDEDEFFEVLMFMLAITCSGFVQFFLATAAGLSFENANRSTPLRISMLAHQAVMLGMLTYALMKANYDFDEYCMLYVSCTCLYWFTMGALMSCEKHQLSLRARRSLPQSMLGRLFFSWFQPGAATGYVFMSTTLVSAVCFVWLLVPAVDMLRPGESVGLQQQAIYNFSVMACSYTIAYVGLGRLCIGLVQRTMGIRMIFGLLLQILMVLTGSIIPMAICTLLDVNISQWRDSALFVLNPFWTLAEVANQSGRVSSIAVFLVPSSALLMIILNLRAAEQELRQSRVATPLRVQEAIAAASKPVQAKELRLSPWDDDDLQTESGEGGEAKPDAAGE